MPYRKSTPDEMLRAWDTKVHALTVVSEEHRLTHDGLGYVMTDVHEGLKNNKVAYALHRTADRYAHLRTCEVAITKGPCDLYIFENPVVTLDEATPLLSSNLNRPEAADNPPSMTHYLNPTVIDEGTLLSRQLIPFGNVGGYSSTFYEEWVMGQNSDYLFKLVNRSGSKIDVACHKFWYELPFSEYSK